MHKIARKRQQGALEGNRQHTTARGPQLFDSPTTMPAIQLCARAANNAPKRGLTSALTALLQPPAFKGHERTIKNKQQW